SPPRAFSSQHRAEGVALPGSSQLKVSRVRRSEDSGYSGVLEDGHHSGVFDDAINTDRVFDDAIDADGISDDPITVGIPLHRRTPVAGDKKDAESHRASHTNRCASANHPNSSRTFFAFLGL